MIRGFKRRYLLLALVAIVLIVGLLYCMDDNKAGIEGNRIGYDCPGFVIKLLMGQPDKMSSYYESGLTTYHYKDCTFFGKDAEITYETQVFGVNRITMTMAVSKDEASAMFDRVRESVKNKYEDDEDFYCNEPHYNSNGSMGQSMGTFDGACSKNFSIFYHDGELEVDGYWQR